MMKLSKLENMKLRTRKYQRGLNSGRQVMLSQCGHWIMVPNDMSVTSISFLHFGQASAIQTRLVTTMPEPSASLANGDAGLVMVLRRHNSI